MFGCHKTSEPTPLWSGLYVYSSWWNSLSLTKNLFQYSGYCAVRTKVYQTTHFESVEFMSPVTFLKWFFSWVAALRIDFRAHVDPYCMYDPPMLASIHFEPSNFQIDLWRSTSKGPPPRVQKPSSSKWTFAFSGLRWNPHWSEQQALPPHRWNFSWICRYWQSCVKSSQKVSAQMYSSCPVENSIWTFNQRQIDFWRFDRVLLANRPGTSAKLKTDIRKARKFFKYWCQKLLGKLEEDEKPPEAELKGKEIFLQVIGVLHAPEVRFTLEQVIHMDSKQLRPEQAALVKWVDLIFINLVSIKYYFIGATFGACHSFLVFYRYILTISGDTALTAFIPLRYHREFLDVLKDIQYGDDSSLYLVKRYCGDLHSMLRAVLPHPELRKTICEFLNGLVVHMQTIHARRFQFSWKWKVSSL